MGELFTPSTEEAQRRSARRAPLCPNGTRAIEIKRATTATTYTAPDGTVFSWDVGDPFWSCPSAGVVYAPPFLQALLAELLFPDDWSLLPPG